MGRMGSLRSSEAEDGDFAWRTGDEREACMLCYTSGTTGNPKGVLYEHRSTVLHAMNACQPWVMALSARETILPIVPMFHAAAWGLPFAAPLAGAKLVLSATNDSQVLCDLMNRERVTLAGGVPTVWMAMFAHMDATGACPSTLDQITVGGSAAPRAMIGRFLDMGVRVTHLWGMTETSPVATSLPPIVDWDTIGREAQLDVVQRQGKAAYGVEIRVVDDDNVECPRDGSSSGRLLVRGPWVVKRYFAAEADTVDADQWFDTGDVAVIHPNGVMQITDRAKDVIKSGGEWISSVELENAAVGCAGVAEAAAIGIYHPRWDERPLLLVVRSAGSTVEAEHIHAHLARHVAKWWLPDEILFVDALPHTATGKLLKTALRDAYRDHRLPSDERERSATSGV